MKLTLEEFKGDYEALKNMYEESPLLALLIERMAKREENDKERQETTKRND